ncbi:unnamed protein product [Linum tenue]|uniref:Uncharacterized protein n=1 Tax=Linum tenue TaxID=586396 RepID=A0AAV0JGD3_9ROSI|nr:unnamed protein product [Linum tenue]
MGPDWASMRKAAVGKALSKAGLDGCYELRRREVVESLSELEVGKPVGVFELAQEVVWNATLGMVWGGDVDYEETREVGNRMLRLLGKPNVSDIFPVLARFDLQGIEREGKEVARRFDRIVSAAIEKRFGGGGEKKEGDRDIAVAGNENISRMIEWAMSELLNSDKAMKSVKRELDEMVGLDSLVEDHHLRNLKYLDAVIKETCRLHLALVTRTANQTCTVGGFTVPQGTEVVDNGWAIHRDPQFWDEPSEFRPERFLDGGDGRPPPFDFMGGGSSSFRYIPFGSGRRSCAGVNLAERMMKYVLASFLHCFEWKLADGEGGVVDFADEFALLIKKKRALIAVPTPRLLTGAELLA